MALSGDLFNPKTIERLCEDVKVTTRQKHAVNEWLKLLEENKLEDEKSNYPKFMQIILQDILGYPIKEINYESGNVEFQFSNSEGQSILCFEAKGTSTKDLFAPQHRAKKEHETPVKQTWDYMGSIGLDYGICTNYKDFVLITKQFGYSKYHLFDFNSIKRNEEKLKEFVGIFSKDRIIDKGFVEKLHKESIIEEREFTQEFYKLFHETRLMMIKSFQENSDVTKDEAIHYTQLCLNRLIFMFFAEDHDFLEDKLFTKRVNEVLNSPLISEHSKMVSDELLGLFQAMDKGSTRLGIFGFNGGLFREQIPPKIYFLDLKDAKFFKDVRQNSKLKIKPDEETKKIINKYQNELNPIIINLLMMDSFDFTTEINVNILGHIFEQSISDLEELKQEGISRRKKEGIYYTPEYITDYICRNTIVRYLSKSGTISIPDLIEEHKNNIDELEKKFREIKILDPACGSGAFLVKAVDILLEIHKEIQIIKESRGTYSTGNQFQLTKWNEEAEARIFVENNIYGVDINSESIEITKLSLFLKIASKNRRLIGLEKNIKIGNSLVDDKSVDVKAFDWNKEFPEVMSFGKFNIIIGNPPYGATFTKEEQEYLKKKFEIGTSDSTQLMIQQSLKLLADNGNHGFIVPKSLTYASNWNKTRDSIIADLLILIDVGKVWKEVKLEQIIYVLDLRTKTDYYYTGTRFEQILDADTKIPKKLCTVFDLLLNGITKKELLLGQKIFEISEKLGDYTTNSRGPTIQSLVKEKGNRKVIGGQQVQRYCIEGEKGWINADGLVANAFLDDNSCLAQNIVAHITNPVDHIKITVTVPQTRDFVILDTVNQIASKKLSPYFVASLLNSKLINWYAYRFIFAKAVRTMHFDSPITNRIPIIVKNEEYVVKTAKELIDKNEELIKIQIEFIENVGRTFDVEKISDQIRNISSLSFDSFIKLMKNRGYRLLPQDEDEYSRYFRNKKSVICDLETKIIQLTQKLNNEFYKIFELKQDEINLIEESTPE